MGKRASREIAANVTHQQLETLFHLPLQQAAAHVGVGRTLFKKICRREGIIHWPQQKRAPKIRTDNAMIRKKKLDINAHSTSTSTSYHEGYAMSWGYPPVVQHGTGLDATSPPGSDVADPCSPNELEDGRTRAADVNYGRGRKVARSMRLVGVKSHGICDLYDAYSLVSREEQARKSAHFQHTAQLRAQAWARDTAGMPGKQRNEPGTPPREEEEEDSVWEDMAMALMRLRGHTGVIYI